MPGVASCGRCGATLVAAPAAIDVHPPRARPAIKRLRSRFYFFYRMRRPFPRLEENIRRQFDALYQDRLPLGVFLRMPIPGWPQFYLGRSQLGKIFLGTYLSMLSIALFWAGTTFGGMAMGVAIACHASSILNVTIARNSDISSRFFYSIACFFCIMTLIYGPSTWLINQVAAPQQFLVDIPPIQAGDVVLYNPSAYRSTEPQVGDLVMYMLPNRVVLNPGNHTQINIGEQPIAGRIIAGPKQTVTVENQQFYIDGKPSPWQLSVPVKNSDAPLLPRELPSDCYYIISDIGPIDNIPTAVAIQPMEVPMAQRHREIYIHYILGKIYWRTQPITRFGPIE
jgi:signal peptidase I